MTQKGPRMTYEDKLRRTREIPCEDPGKPILEHLEAAGLEIESICRRGDCRRCIIIVLEGHRHLYEDGPPFALLPEEKVRSCITKIVEGTSPETIIRLKTNRKQTTPARAFVKKGIQWGAQKIAKRFGV